ncbi:MAG: hypothetical protein EBS65_15565, partial [Betaproteobacteria bacterium]|nr:hypothetical protein [Betaproteobacteria bacterium]
MPFFLRTLTVAGRSLRTRPFHSIALLIVLAVGVGSSSAVLSVLDTVFIRPPSAVRRPQELRRIVSRQRSMAGTDYWNDRFSARDFEQLSASGGPGVSILAYDLADRRRIGDGADRGSVAYVTANYFSILGVPLLSGRTFGSNEDNYRDPRRVTVLSLQFANHFFGGSRQALGQTLRVDNVSYTVVGVADGNFSGVDLDRVTFVYRARPG